MDYTSLAERAVQAAREGQEDAAWERIARLAEEPAATLSLAIPLREPALDRPRRVALAHKVLSRSAADVDTVIMLADAVERLADLRFLNAAPQGGFFDELVRVLIDLFERSAKDTTRVAIRLANAARVAGRAWDAVADETHRFIVSRTPDSAAAHYDYGLFLKNRGRFRESVHHNRRSFQLDPDDKATLWNLGIACTAIGDGATAIELWRTLGAKLELNEDGLPEGTWDPVQVRLAERPVAERDAAQDDPGLEETIWIERLSPCHGRVRSALYQDLRVDYGDLVLFDGAPITHRTSNGQRTPVFPHLVTLKWGGWRMYPFAGRQGEQGKLAAVSDRLPDETMLYVHTEQLKLLCRGCWERSDHREHSSELHRVVSGKLCVPPDTRLEQVGEALDTAMHGEGFDVYVPTLRALLGDADRADVDERRMAMVMNARQATP